MNLKLLIQLNEFNPKLDHLTDKVHLFVKQEKIQNPETYHKLHVTDMIALHYISADVYQCKFTNFIRNWITLQTL